MSSPAVLSSEDSHGSQYGSEVCGESNHHEQGGLTRSRSSSRSSSPIPPRWSPITPVLMSSSLPDVPEMAPLTTTPIKKGSASRSGKSRKDAEHSILRDADTEVLHQRSAPSLDDDNSDVLATRAALNVLQIQRQRTLQDIRKLRDQRAAALEDPEGFSFALVRGKLSTPDVGRAIQGPASFLDEKQKESTTSTPSVTEEEDPLSSSSNGAAFDAAAFGKLPKPQNIVRCPPVNWAKYHVIGEALDVLHEEQRRKPQTGLPHTHGLENTPEHVVMAPYRPFIDKLETPKPSHRKRMA